MRLDELLTLGARPGAGLLLALTSRCPLSCAHCSTSSGPGSPQYSGGPFLRLVRSFTPQEHPEVILMSGGEPLLRPGLVAGLAAAARDAGTRSALVSGMFFARRGGAVPASVLRAARGLDHFAASIDRHHEREVDRAEVFDALGRLGEVVPGLSVHITGTPADDEYIRTLTSDVRRRFGHRVSVLVARVAPTGRARAWPDAAPPPAPRTDGPCVFAAWPLVDYDGAVYACSRQSLVRAARPGHLVLGHAAEDSWGALRERALGDRLLRSVRAIGPVATRQRFGPDRADGCPDGACATCLSLSDQPRTAERAGRYLASPAGHLVEATVHRMIAGLPAPQLARLRGAVLDGDLGDQLGDQLGDDLDRASNGEPARPDRGGSCRAD
jgi:pyruvate-formate lyase-activating enzyme